MASTDTSRRPKLSLQIKPATTPQVRTRKSALAHANPRSPTTFNTLSNVYVTAIERSTPVQSTPLTAINTQLQHQEQHQPLRLQTDLTAFKDHQHRAQSPYNNTTYPDTPLSANPISPAQQMDIVFPSQQMTATPPLSAGPTEPSGPKPFSFVHADAKKMISMPQSPAQARRRAIYGAFGAAVAKAPYSHNRSLHSILRNSPLPPTSAISSSPISPRRQSRRLQEKAARRVGYESPLTQTITTEKYTRSHIDLLAEEEPSPYTPSPAVEDSEMMLDIAMQAAYHETRDGGQTPGPFEEMRRRMTTLGTGAETTTSSSTTPAVLSPRTEGVRKRKKKEKKRKWVWTIGKEEDDNDGSGSGSGSGHGGAKGDEEESGAMRAIRESASASISTSTSTSAPRATGPPVLALPVPVPRRRPRLVKFDNDNNNSNNNTSKAETPEPVTAIQTSVEHPLGELSESSDAATTADHVDVEMSDDADGRSTRSSSSSSSSRATTPYSSSMDLDATTPTATFKRAAPPVLAVKTEEDRLGSWDLVKMEETGSSGRRDTPIPPDLVADGGEL